VSRTRWLDIAAIALAVAVIAGMCFVLRPQHTPTVKVTPFAARVDRPQLAPQPGPSVLFIGDSYVSGSGPKEMSYSCMAAVRMGWLCALSGVPSTGYIAGGPKSRFHVNEDIGTSTTFAERVPHLGLMYRPDIVVLDGGRYDFGLPRDDVFNAMTWTLGAVRHTWPLARVVFIRPRLLARPTDDLGFDNQFIDRLRAEPVALGVVVVDPIARLSHLDTSTMLSSKGMHPNRVGAYPNQEGALALSSALVDSLVAEGISRGK
jgi:hypothetical protein